MTDNTPTSERPLGTGPTEPRPTPPEQSQTLPAAPPMSKELRVLHNLAAGLSLAIDLSEEGAQFKLHAVVSREGLRPEVHTFETKQALIEFLLPLRGTQSWVFIFRGVRWTLRQPGPGEPWQLYDGKSFTPVVQDVDSMIATMEGGDGSMMGHVHLPDVPDEPEDPEPDPEPDNQAEPDVSELGPAMPAWAREDDDDESDNFV